MSIVLIIIIINYNIFMYSDKMFEDKRKMLIYHLLMLMGWIACPANNLKTLQNLIKKCKYISNAFKQYFSVLLHFLYFILLLDACRLVWICRI